MPVGARTTDLFLVVEVNMLSRVDLPVPARPVMNKWLELLSISFKASLNAGLNAIGSESFLGFNLLAMF